jgi:hypothetical protein
MTVISSTNGATRRTTEDDHSSTTTTTQTKRELDSSWLPSTHSAADLAAIARNFVQHEVSTLGREKVTSSAATSHTYASEADARAAFATKAKTFADVGNWTALSGRENAKFDLFDESGKAVHGRAAAVRDFVRVQLPGQKQFDWVRVEDVSIGADRVGICVRPTFDPTKSPRTPDVVAHFFTRETTNNFFLERSGTTLTARVEGRQESANVAEHSGGIANAVRNRAACEGAWGIRRTIPGTHTEVNGLQQHQWNRFTENLTRP